MRNRLSLLFSILMICSFCTQNRIKVIFDTKIKYQALNNIKVHFPTDYSIDSTYSTTYKAKNMVEDKIEFDYLGNEHIKKSFSCNHYFDKDTLIIDGGFGSIIIKKRYGFIAKIFPDNTAEIQLQLNGNANYFKNINDTTHTRSILIDTKKGRIILNRKPKDENDKKHIYGYIEFLSDDYYILMQNEITKELYKEKNSSEYKIFFDSRYFEDKIK